MEWIKQRVDCKETEDFWSNYYRYTFQVCDYYNLSDKAYNHIRKL